MFTVELANRKLESSSGLLVTPFLADYVQM